MEQDISRNLKALRELRGLTQAELGTRAGMAAAAISHFENGQRTPSVDSLVKLADGLDVPVDVLLGRTAVETTASMDPLFLQASRAKADTLDRVRRVVAALLAAEEADSPSIRRMATPGSGRRRNRAMILHEKE